MNVTSGPFSLVRCFLILSLPIINPEYILRAGIRFRTDICIKPVFFLSAEFYNFQSLYLDFVHALFDIVYWFPDRISHQKVFLRRAESTNLFWTHSLKSLLSMPLSWIYAFAKILENGQIYSSIKRLIWSSLCPKIFFLLQSTCRTKHTFASLPVYGIAIYRFIILSLTFCLLKWKFSWICL